MSSAIGTRRWNTLRATYAERLAYLGSVTCWRWATSTDPAPTCTHTIQHGQPWVLGHIHDRALGGDDSQLGYECVPCSNRSGGKLGALIRKVGARQAARKPSRAW